VTEMLAWSAQLPEADYPPDTVLIREGERPGLLYVLVDGTVEVIRGGSPVAVIDEPGAILGEMGVLLNGPATATVRTVRESRLRRSDDPRGFLTAHPRVAYSVAVTLAERLDTITGFLVDLRRQYADRQESLGMVDVVLERLSLHRSRPFEPGSERKPESPY
jgi:CRP/FNR family transcriptional regulator, cyclic AMP receptor protein